MEYYKGKIPIYDGSTEEGRSALFPGVIEGNLVGFGLVPRDYSVQPAEMGAAPSEMDVIPESEWDARYDEQEELKSSLEHIYLPEPNKPAFEHLDQDGFPDCWCYSTGHAIMLSRLRQNLPTVRLNPTAVATILRRTNGGWSALSAQFAAEHGFPEEGTGPGQWPKLSRNGKDTPELRESMKKYKVLEDWADLSKQVYYRNLTRAQAATCGFKNDPAQVDFNPWSHAVCQVRWVRTESGSWAHLILNSWKGWGYHGLGVVRWICDGAVSVRATAA